MDHLETAKRLSINLLTNFVPAPIAAIIQTIDDCASEEELAKQFDKLKNEIRDFADTTWLPVIPFSVETHFASLAVIYLLHEIADEQAKNIEYYLSKNEVIQYFNETCCDRKTITIQAAVPIEKEIFKNDFVNPVIEILKNYFDIEAKTVLYA